jgi:NAD+ synthetase
MNTLINEVKTWFNDNYLDTAIIGYSGGVDSSTTAALCHAAGLNTVIVEVSHNSMQKYSSPVRADEFASNFKGMKVEKYTYSLDSNLTNMGAEAAIPIIRNAYFYATAAQQRRNNLFPCVVGTVNFSEAAYLGFWGKASDAAQDLYPISGLYKHEVYELAEYLGIPEEIINANPSGDLLFSDECDDKSMIGANYYEVFKIAELAKDRKNKELKYFVKHMISNKDKFCYNILSNSFKYKNPFPGFHLSNKLEEFRKKDYNYLLRQIASCA